MSTTTRHSDAVQVYNYTFCLYGQFHNCNLSTGNYCIYEEKLILRVEANQKRYRLSLWKKIYHHLDVLTLHSNNLHKTCVLETIFVPNI